MHPSDIRRLLPQGEAALQGLVGFGTDAGWRFGDFSVLVLLVLLSVPPPRAFRGDRRLLPWLRTLEVYAGRLFGIVVAGVRFRHGNQQSCQHDSFVWIVCPRPILGGFPRKGDVSIQNSGTLPTIDWG